MSSPLLCDLVPQPPEPDAVFDAFVTWAKDRGLTPYPAQEEALLEVVADSHVVLSTPTGSGKSLVATGAQFAALARGQRSFYTAPIKALVSEKFFALVETFGAANVGMMTGDATVNGQAPVICCTAEILANLALREGAAADVGLAVLDEFHYYADPERGWAWQVPLLELTRTQFLLMSATLGDVTALRERLTARSGRETALVTGTERPVPLSFSYVTTPLHETLEELLSTHQAPVYVVHSTQAAAIEQAQALMSINVCSRDQKDAIAALIGEFRFSTGFGRSTLSRLVRHGIGVHHAGMLPKYRRLVELLAQAGLLKVICGTDTLGVGINVPIRTVLFTSLTKYDGVRTRHLKAREFHQIAGRAGRAGFDTAGTVVVQAPEHDVENAKRIAKAGDDPKKLKRVERKKPPEGFVSWGEPTFTRLVAAEPETLTSTFRVSHSMLLQVVQREGDFFAHMRHLLLANDEPRTRQRALVRQAIRIFRALERAGTIQRVPPGPDGRTVRLTVDLQRDFALDQPLSPFAVAALELLDRESPTYGLDVLSTIEATLDDPRQVLHAQRSKAKGEAVAEMKQAGIEYEERMELLEDVTWPMPLAQELEGALESYRLGHPWVADEQLSPKSIARDLAERAMTFTEYVSFYGLARSEGLVLRYLAGAYKAMRRTVPEQLRTEEVDDLTVWLGELVRQVDSSLLEEWESLANPEDDVAAPVRLELDAPARGVTRNERAFRVMVRQALFRRVEQLALRHWIDLGELDPDFGPDAWEVAVRAYFAEHDSVGTGPDARGPLLFQVQTGALTAGDGPAWRVRQVLDDPAGDRDWAITVDVDLAASDAEGSPVLRVLAVGPDLVP